MSELIQSGS